MAIATFASRSAAAMRTPEQLGLLRMVWPPVHRIIRYQDSGANRRSHAGGVGGAHLRGTWARSPARTLIAGMHEELGLPAEDAELAIDRVCEE